MFTVEKVLFWVEWKDLEMNRRELLVKMSIMGGLALTQPWQIVKLLGVRDHESALQQLRDWDISADAYSASCASPRKRILNSMLFTGQGLELITDYGVDYLSPGDRTTVGAVDWTDGTNGSPTSAWFDNFAANFPATTYCDWFFFDHENWPFSTQAERLDSAHKFALLYAGIKSRLPNMKFGFYSYPLLRDYFQSGTLPGNASYEA